MNADRLKPVACLHCGDLSLERFCCAGCSHAYQLLKGAGLESVYTQDNRRWRRPQFKEAERFHFFRDREFLDRRAPLGADGLRQIELRLEGLMCSACIWVVEHLPRLLSDIVESRVDYGRSRIRLKFRDDNEALGHAAEILSRLGYELHPQELDLSSSRIPKIEWIRLGVAGLSAAGAMHTGLVLIGAHSTAAMPASDARLVGYFAGATALPALTFGAWPFFKSAYQNLRMKFLSADVLISLAVLLGTIASFRNAYLGEIESYFDSLAMVIFLLLAGRIVIRLSTLKVSEKPLWWARQNGALIPAERLKVSEKFETEAGDVCPLDAHLLSHSAWFDLSSLTGESLPVRVLKGQEVPQGAIAQSSSVLQAVRSLKDSSIEVLSSRVSTMAWQSFPPVYEGIFTLVICALALSVLMVGGVTKVTQAIAILIVTCPCALQMAKPLGLTAFRKMSFKKGFLLLHPEKALHWAQVKNIFIDKTGTLTQGCPRLQRTIEIVSSDLPRITIDDIIYQLAVKSKHPFSKALAMEFSEAAPGHQMVEALEERPGIGIFGRWNGRSVSLQRPSDPKEEMSAASFFLDGTEVLQFTFADSLRDEARGALSALKDLGLKIHLLSGDRRSECKNIERQLGLNFETLIGEATPETKAEVVGQCSYAGFVGDGLNDALAMQASFASLGFSGSAEANLQAADAYLISHDLQKLSDLIHMSRLIRRRIHLSLAVSFLYNVLSIALIFAGFLGPVLCAIFMPLSSLSVVAIFAKLPSESRLSR